jgi:polar amino acid transport system permease protein
MNPIQNFLRTYDVNAVTNNWHAPLIMQGLLITIILAVLAQFIGVVIGLVLYFMRRARFAPVRWIAETYILVFRGTPLLVQVLFTYLLFQYIGVARPLRATDLLTAIGFVQVLTDAFVAGLVALSLNEGAYMAEIVRAGIDSIDAGQMEAARSLGMTYWLGMRRIVLPQAMRVIIPPLGNEFNSMIKSTSLVSAITVYDLLGAAEAIGSPSFRTLELLTVAVFWYLLLTTIWTFIQIWLERRFSASTREPGGPKSIWERLTSGLLLPQRWTGPMPVPAGGDLRR